MDQNLYDARMPTSRRSFRVCPRVVCTRTRARNRDPADADVARRCARSDADPRSYLRHFLRRYEMTTHTAHSLDLAAFFAVVLPVRCGFGEAVAE